MPTRESVRSVFCVLFVTVAALFVTRSACADPLERTDDDVDAIVLALVDHLKSNQVTDPGEHFGSFRGEMGGVHAGGISALATFALLHSGVPWHDATIERALDYLDDHPLPGTYSRSLRASIWAHLLTTAGDAAPASKWRKLLKADTDWLVGAMKLDGYYGYDKAGLGGDHSCTQFGVLGVWASETAMGEAPLSYWQRVCDHWLTMQNTDGSWGYTGNDPGRITMTTAGANTLYIVLSNLYARKEPAYQELRGVRLRSDLRGQVDAVLNSIRGSMGWLSERGILDRKRGYQLFGLERLGVASGRKYVGGQDWYRDGVQTVSSSSRDTKETAFDLLFLTYGRAPVLINKLQHGSGNEWDYYYRDLHHLTRWLSANDERIYRWQIVSPDSSLHDLEDAPILLISGSGSLALNVEQRQRLRAYIDGGGTIVGHANNASKEFARNFTEMFENLFADRDWRFKALPDNHDLFSVRFGHSKSGWASRLRIEAIDDGLRSCIFLLPADIAGAWHQNRHRQYTDFFQLMANLRVYCAPQYDDLPRRLRVSDGDQQQANQIGYLTISGLTSSGVSVPSCWRWHVVAESLSSRVGVAVVDAPVSGAPVDVIRLGGPTPLALSSQDNSNLAERMKSGSLLIIESRGGGQGFDESARKLLDELAVGLSATVSPLADDHPILTGEMVGGIKADSWRCNRWGAAVLRGRAPTVTALQKDDEVLALWFKFDLFAKAGGHVLCDTPAYRLEPSKTLAHNLLLWSYIRATNGTSVDSIATVAPAAREVDDLALLAEALADQGQLARAAEIICVVDSLAPNHESIAAFRGRIQRELTDQITQAVRKREHDRAQRLRAFLLELVPDSTAALEIIEHEAPKPADWPDELSEIALEVDGQQTNALILLREWSQLDIRIGEIDASVEAIRIRLKALDEQATQLRIEQSKQQRKAGSRRSRVPNPEVQQIARDRKTLKNALSKATSERRKLTGRTSRIYEALIPLSPQLAEHGVVRQSDRWVKE